MISFNEAVKIVQRELETYQHEVGSEVSLVLMMDETIIEDFGWVFFYNSKEFLDSGDISFSLIGNAPLIVDKRNGEIHATGTNKPIKFYIDEYKSKRE